MATRCGNCLKLEKYKYWNEFPLEHRFFKVMNCDFELQLWLPKKFVEFFRDQLSDWCTLIGPSENKWTVRLSSTEENGHERLIFSDGWDKFIIDHAVKLCDFLIFQYTGQSSFKVFIFDPTGCEREEAYFAKNRSTSRTSCRSTLHAGKTIGRSENICVSANFGEGLQPKSVVKKENPISGAEGESLSDNYEEETELSSESNQFRPSSSSRRKSTRVKQSQRIHKSDRRPLTQQEEKSVLEKAAAHKRKRGVPTVKISMEKTYVYEGFHMTIPKKWALKNMLGESHNVELRVPSSGRSWTVGCRWTKQSQQCQLTANWMNFVFDNTLEQHDVCVFELIKKGKSGGTRTPIFNVYIYRALDSITPLTISRHLI